MLKTINRWMQPPVYRDDEEKTRIARIVHILFGALIIVSLLTILVDHQRSTVTILLVGIAFALIAYGLNRSGFPRIAGYVLLFIYLIALTVLLLVGSGIHDIAMTGLPVLLIMSALVLERRGVIAFVVLTIAAAGLVTFAGMGGLPGIEIHVPGHTYFFEFLIVAAILGVAGLSSHILIDQLFKSLTDSRVTEAQIVSIVENSPDLIMKINQTGRILLANRHAEIYQGKRLQEFVSPDDYGRVEESLAQAFNAGKNVALELQAKEIDGTFQWNSIRVAPVKTGGKITSLVVILTNIHAQQEAALQIQQSADRLAVLNEIGRAATALADLDSVLETIQRQVERVVPLDVFFVTLYHPETNMVSYPLVFDHGQRWVEPDTELVPEAYSSQVLQTGKSILVLATPEEIERDRQKGESIRIGDSAGISASMIYVPMFIKGRIIGTLSAQTYSLNAYTEDHLRLLEGVANQVAIAIENSRLFTNVQTELAERQRAEGEARRLEELYRHAIESAGAVPYYRDYRNHAYTFMGEDIQKITGYTAADMTPALWSTLEQEGFPRGSMAHLTYEEAARLSEDGLIDNWECDYRIITRDGQTRWVADSGIRVYDEQGMRVGVIGILQDITERKHAEEMQKKLIDELEQRNAELERLAYTLSHELRSPLITISGFVSYLRRDALSGNMDRLEADIRRITSGVEKMRHLTNELIDLMSVGRIDNEFSEIPLRNVVDEAIGLVREGIEEKHIAVQIADDLPRVFGDRKRLLEVFQNLLENSMKFMGEQPEPRIKIGQRMEPDGQVAFFIRDNGIGIEPRFRERVFGIFQKLDVQSEGTGIGLALVKRIIEVHNGRVWVESDGLGKGSTFCFTIPDSRK